MGRTTEWRKHRREKAGRLEAAAIWSSVSEQQVWSCGKSEAASQVAVILRTQF